MANNNDKKSFNKYGQFMTEDKLVNNVLNKINIINPIKGNILEPSFGKGAFINGLNNHNFDSLDAFEIDENIFKQFSIDNKNVNLFLGDFLLSDSDKTYDHIIGNPPYVEINYSYYKQEMMNILKDKYKFISDGRLNLVHMFIHKSFELLKNDGYLSFLLPSVTLTSPYYKKLRKFIYDNFNVEYVKNDVKFSNVSIKVSLLILKKTNNNSDNFFVNYDNNYYITENYKIYPKNLKNLKDLNFKVNIGNICWNHHKEELTDDKNYTPIIYTKNIINNNICLDVILSKSGDKKQYIKNNDIRYKNFIAMPRIISNNSKIILIKNNIKYHVENHLLIITHSDISKLEKLYNLFINKEIDKYIDLFKTSSTISARELLSIPLED